MHLTTRTKLELSIELPHAATPIVLSTMTRRRTKDWSVIQPDGFGEAGTYLNDLHRDQVLNEA